jgi:hypothetical protein
MRPLTIFLSRLIGQLFILAFCEMRVRRQSFVDIASGIGSRDGRSARLHYLQSPLGCG